MFLRVVLYIYIYMSDGRIIFGRKFYCEDCYYINMEMVGDGVVIYSLISSIKNGKNPNQYLFSSPQTKLIDEQFFELIVEISSL
jgi:hypothetical protein